MRQTGPMTADEAASYITSTFPDAKVAQAMGATFFSLTDNSWPNFATMVTTDEHDEGAPSNLTARGAYRLNIGVGRESFLAIARRADPGPDYAVFDELMPHPTYAKQRWVAIVNPTRQTFDEQVRPLLDEAYRKLARTLRRSPAG